MRSASSPRAVSMITGMAAVAGSARSAWQTSKPSMPGNIRSSTIASGAVARTFGRTADPDATESTLCPAFWR